MIKNDELYRNIADIFKQQKLGVLATISEDGPYQSLVAIAVLPGLKEIVFATDKNTSKFRNIQKTDEVSLLVDNRTGLLNDLKSIIIVTAIGNASEVEGAFEEGPGREYMDCHPLLGQKFLTDSSALVSIKVKKYIVVTCFNEVNEFYP